MLVARLQEGPNIFQGEIDSIYHEGLSARTAVAAPEKFVVRVGPDYPVNRLYAGRTVWLKAFEEAVNVS
jgi:hypothetical protein